MRSNSSKVFIYRSALELRVIGIERRPTWLGKNAECIGGLPQGCRTASTAAPTAASAPAPASAAWPDRRSMWMQCRVDGDVRHKEGAR